MPDVRLRGKAMENDAAYIRDLVRRGGPCPDEYDKLSAWYVTVMTRYYAGEIADNHISSLREAFGESFTPRTMQGFVVTKPHGYHGDFEVIDRIYSKWLAEEEHLQKWDLWFHQLHAVRAVRNRKDYFHRLLADMSVQHLAGPVRVLDVGCGPCRDVAEFLATGSSNHFLFTCLDQDEGALDYAGILCADHLDGVDLQLSPILRFSSEQPFNLVWCGGVFDYLTDRVFTLTLRRLLRFVADDGQMVLGNFSPVNPTRPIMEFGGWRLFHRTESELVTLAIDAGIRKDDIFIGHEPEGVNLFLHIRKTA
jgi:extracellular factor (EF) 3-hydroxypalmitic acid methyl ester biosynthesis protein